jgi:hypothetical protein
MTGSWLSFLGVEQLPAHYAVDVDEDKVMQGLPAVQ